MKGNVKRFLIGLVIILIAASAGSASLFLQQNRNKTYRPLNPVDPGSEKYQGAGTIDANSDGVPDFGITISAVTPTSARIIFTNAQTNVITHMAIAMDVEPAAWQTFVPSVDITGSTGTHTVYVKVKTKNGKISKTLSGTVLLEPAVYVSTAGNDAASGTRAYPMKTIQLAIYKTIAQGSHTVMVAQGEYTPGNGLLQDIKGGIIITNHGVRLLGGWNIDFSVQNGFSSLKATAMRGIYAEKVSNLFIERFSIYNAKVPADNGGGLYLNAVTNSTLTNINIYECYALNGGGAAVLFSRSNSIHATIYGNKASALGGGMYINENSDGIDSLYYGRIYGNEAVMGGGIYAGLQGDKVYSSVYGNYASDKGGGAYITIMRETFYGDIYQNSATFGGGVYIPQQNDPGMSMRFGRIYQNNAFKSGGGVFMDNVDTGEFVFSAVSNNAYSNGGGIYLNCTSVTIKGSVDYNKVTMVYSALSGNGSGAGIYIYNSNGGYVQVLGSISSNTGDAIDGAGVLLNASGYIFEASNVSYNATVGADFGGGGICVLGSNNLITNTVFSHNKNADGDNIYIFGESNRCIGVQANNAPSICNTSFLILGNNTILNNCSVMSNVFTGITVKASNTVIKNCAVAYNGTNGITDVLFSGIMCSSGFEETPVANWLTIISNVTVFSNISYGIAILGGIMDTNTPSPNRMGGPIIIQNSYITNNAGPAAVYLAIESNVYLSNNVFGCASAAATAAVDEYYVAEPLKNINAISHAIVDNIFITNRMQYIYRDYNNATVSDIANLTTGNTGAATVSGNTAVTN